jgi:hypothetical protein
VQPPPAYAGGSLTREARLRGRLTILLVALTDAEKEIGVRRVRQKRGG